MWLLPARCASDQRRPSVAPRHVGDSLTRIGGLGQRAGRLAYFGHVLVMLRGTRRCACPCCGHSGRFGAFGHPPRYDARCPRCGSLERHRLIALALRRRAIDVEHRDVLHFAPEPAVTRLVEPLARSYVTADIDARGVDLAIDMQATGLGDQTFDVIIASGVLEHVPDDERALRECRRLLRPGGVLVALVPVVESWATTYEDAAITTGKDRVHHFGQQDHLRMYGRDVRDRFRDTGFEVGEFAASPIDGIELGLARGEKIFLLARAGE